MTNQMKYRNPRPLRQPGANGLTSITTTTAGTAANVTVTFPAFAQPPIITANPATAVPHQCSPVGIGTVTTTSAVLWLTRSTTGATGIYWTAEARTS